jgi:hypothetical protein
MAAVLRDSPKDDFVLRALALTDRSVRQAWRLVRVGRRAVPVPRHQPRQLLICEAAPALGGAARPATPAPPAAFRTSGAAPAALGAIAQFTTPCGACAACGNVTRLHCLHHHDDFC